jgi:hypothetical protein
MSFKSVEEAKKFIGSCPELAARLLLSVKGSDSWAGVLSAMEDGPSAADCLELVYFHRDHRGSWKSLFTLEMVESLKDSSVGYMSRIQKIIHETEDVKTWRYFFGHAGYTPQTAPKVMRRLRPDGTSIMSRHVSNGAVDILREIVTRTPESGQCLGDYCVERPLAKYIEGYSRDEAGVRRIPPPTRLKEFITVEKLLSRCEDAKVRDEIRELLSHAPEGDKSGEAAKKKKLRGYEDDGFIAPDDEDEERPKKKKKSKSRDD